MTGSIPSFSDIVLNVAESDDTSSLAGQDNLLTQLKMGLKKRMVMYGDDTWLRLFPGTFDRFDGTTSFFVSVSCSYLYVPNSIYWGASLSFQDFVEVDNNVTRHIPHELGQDDWSTMVLHYLGLDHIGHKAGPKRYSCQSYVSAKVLLLIFTGKSRHMFPKQQEMDSVVREIYTAIQREKHLQSTLLVLCGDHGMNDIGNHGGSSAGETSPALVFISPLFEGKIKGNDCPTQASADFQYYELVEQSDITPTIAAMLGVPIPLNNLGVFIPPMLDMWDSSM
jgi:ethanolaminephosphotransferase